MRLLSGHSNVREKGWQNGWRVSERARETRERQKMNPTEQYKGDMRLLCGLFLFLPIYCTQLYLDIKAQVLTRGGQFYDESDEIFSFRRGEKKEK